MTEEWRDSIEHCLNACARQASARKETGSVSMCEGRHGAGELGSFRVIGVWCVWSVPSIIPAWVRWSQIGRKGTGGGHGWLWDRPMLGVCLWVGSVAALCQRAPPGVAPTSWTWDRCGAWRVSCVARIWFMGGTLFCLSAPGKAVSPLTTVSTGTKRAANQTQTPKERGNFGLS